MKTVLLFLILPVILDRIIGDPHSFPHPITYVGKTISKYEKYIRALGISLKVGGFILLILSLITVISIISLVILIAGKVSESLSIVISIYFLYTSLASRCLDIEARKVYDSLLKDKIEVSRIKLSYLVGRDTSSLTKEEVIKGTVETVAENTIDGILAPLMFIAIGIYFGYPVQFVFFYKTINTLDSMVGYKNEKYGEIGYASAKLDDIVNYIAARLGSIAMLFGAFLLRMDFKNGWKILKRDRRNHNSPNCAYPEAVVSGALNIRLGGTHTYFGKAVYKPTIGDANRAVKSEDIIYTIKIMYISEFILSILLTIVLLIIIGLK